MVATMTQEIWLVRHGETDWSRAGRFCGWADPPLNEAGRAEARALRVTLAAQSFESVTSSPSARAVETARLAYGLPTIDERFRELDFGDIEGWNWRRCPVPLGQQLADFDGFQAPNGESVADLANRVDAGLRDLGPGRHLVVTHGGVVRLLARRSLSVVPHPSTGSLTRLIVTEGANGTEFRLLARASNGSDSRSSTAVASSTVRRRGPTR